MLHCLIMLHYLNLQLGSVAGVVGRLGLFHTIILCPNTHTQDMTDMDSMPHEMIACGMQASICDEHVMWKHGNALWHGSNVHSCMHSPTCASQMH